MKNTKPSETTIKVAADFGDMIKEVSTPDKELALKQIAEIIWNAVYVYREAYVANELRHLVRKLYGNRLSGDAKVYATRLNEALKRVAGIFSYGITDGDRWERFLTNEEIFAPVQEELQNAA